MKRPERHRALREIRAVLPRQKVILTSGIATLESSPIVQRLADELGVTTMLSKPFARGCL